MPTTPSFQKGERCIPSTLEQVGSTSLSFFKPKIQISDLTCPKHLPPEHPEVGEGGQKTPPEAPASHLASPHYIQPAPLLLRFILLSRRPQSLRTRVILDQIQISAGDMLSLNSKTIRILRLDLEINHCSLSKPLPEKSCQHA